jgi:hypothetical protein
MKIRMPLFGHFVLNYFRVMRDAAELLQRSHKSPATPRRGGALIFMIARGPIVENQSEPWPGGLYVFQSGRDMRGRHPQAVQR